MRQGIAIFFAFLMLSVSCKELFQYAAFKLNQDYISTVFCINKDKPEMKCDGKCYLKKTMDTSKEEKQSKALPPPDEKSILVYFELPYASLAACMTVKPRPLFNYIESLSSLSDRAILHPPESWI